MAYTNKSIINLMAKNEFDKDEIRYILRVEERTELYLMDGRRISTSIPLAYFDSFLGDEDFTRINKKVLVSNAQVVNVIGVNYLMTDGVSLEGRHRNMKAHTDFMVKMANEHADEDRKKTAHA